MNPSQTPPSEPRRGGQSNSDAARLTPDLPLPLPLTAPAPACPRSSTPPRTTRSSLMHSRRCSNWKSCGGCGVGGGGRAAGQHQSSRRAPPARPPTFPAHYRLCRSVCVQGRQQALSRGVCLRGAGQGAPALHDDQPGVDRGRRCAAAAAAATLHPVASKPLEKEREGYALSMQAAAAPAPPAPPPSCRVFAALRCPQARWSSSLAFAPR